MSKDKISLHGSFGYISFNINSSDDPATLEPAAAYTLEEAGPIVTQGDDYTEVVGDADGCVVAPKAYTKEKNPMYLYSDTYGDVTELPEEVCKVFREDKEKGAFKDAYLADDRLNEMAADLYKEYGAGCCTVRWKSRSTTVKFTDFWQPTAITWKISGTGSGMNR